MTLWCHATCAMNFLIASSRVGCLQAQVLELQVGILKIKSDHLIPCWTNLGFILQCAKELAKIGREALEFKQKAENAAVDLHAGALEPWSLGGAHVFSSWMFAWTGHFGRSRLLNLRGASCWGSPSLKLKRMIQILRSKSSLSTSCLLSAEVGCNEAAKSELAKCLR